ncbi:MAG: lytic transglycosylase domain-containing protein [Clostridia bacterium]|nr:lytic transglycosylase domain-containing protein [Clostridia bacterium]
MILAVAVIMIIAGIKTCKNLLYPLEYQDIIVKYANENELDQCLVMAVIKTESNFVEDAHSGKASGLMQLTDDTASWIASKTDVDIDKINLMNPKDNIRMGCYYLRYLIDYYEGNVDVALAAYNGGMGNVDKWLKDERYSEDGVNLKYIPFKETREYVKKVNNECEVYRKMLAAEKKIKNN